MRRHHDAAALLRAGEQNDAAEALELLAAGAEIEMQRHGMRLHEKLMPPASLADLCCSTAKSADADSDRFSEPSGGRLVRNVADSAATRLCLTDSQTGASSVSAALERWRTQSRMALQGWQAHQLMCARCGSPSATQLVPFYVLSLGALCFPYNVHGTGI